MNIDNNGDFKKLKRKLFFSTLITRSVLGLLGLLYTLWRMVKFIFAPLALLLQFFLFIPLIYFTNKQDREMPLNEIDMDVLHDEVFEEIQEDIALFETLGFTELKLVQGDLVDEKATIFTQLMLNESNGIALALMYGVFRDGEGEYSNIQISYQEFAFETRSGEEFEFHNAKKESIPLTNRVTRLYVEEYDSKIFYEKVLDIAKRVDVTINRNRMNELKNNPVALLKKSYKIDMEYLVEIGYFKLKDNYLRPSLKASALGVFKEMWPVSGYLTKKSWERTLKFFKDIDFNVEEKNYYDMSDKEIPLEKKITTLQNVKEFLSLYRTSYFRPMTLEFRFFDETDNIEEMVIHLAHQKLIGRGKCILTSIEVELNNSNQMYHIYDYQNIEIQKCSSKKYIKELQDMVEPREVLLQIKEKYSQCYIDSILLTATQYEAVIEVDIDGELDYKTLYIDCKSGEWIRSEERIENDSLE